jgi:hypothetical protein
MKINNFSIRIIFLLSMRTASAMGDGPSTELSFPQPLSVFSHTICKLFTMEAMPVAVHQGLPEVVWAKSTDEFFNECIVSWNALRPTKGFMTIWVSLKHRGEWSRWHRLAQWGPNFQRTFVNKLNPYVHTKHCRVEMQHGSLARGFRVRVTFHKGADPTNLKALFACASRLDQFKLVIPKRNLPSVGIRDVPRQSQMVLDHPRFRDLCSPVSTSMVVAYLWQKLYNILPTPSMPSFALDFAKRAHDQGYLNIYGNWILNVAQAFEACNGDVFFRVERLNSFYDLYRFLNKKIPVAVSVRRLRGGATPYANGHILVVAGWNRLKQCVICVDPAFAPSKVTLRAYPLRAFLRAWSRSSNLAYVPMPKQSLV